MAEYEILLKSQHKKLGFKRPLNYSIALSESFLPITGKEIPYLWKDVPIVFIKRPDNSFFLAILLKLYEDFSPFLNKGGEWLSDYVPAILITYPFKMLTLKIPEKEEKEEKQALGFIKGSPHLSFEKDNGFDPVFKEDGQLSGPIDLIAKILSSFGSDKETINSLITKFETSNILKEIAIQDQNGKRTKIPNVFSIDESMLKKLSAKQVKGFIDDGGLDLIYYQKFSVSNIQKLLKRQDSVAISTRDKVITATKEKKAAEINDLVKTLLGKE